MFRCHWIILDDAETNGPLLSATLCLGARRARHVRGTRHDDSGRFHPPPARSRTDAFYCRAPVVVVVDVAVAVDIVVVYAYDSYECNSYRLVETPINNILLLSRR